MIRSVIGYAQIYSDPISLMKSILGKHNMILKLDLRQSRKLLDALL